MADRMVHGAYVNNYNQDTMNLLPEENNVEDLWAKTNNIDHASKSFTR